MINIDCPICHSSGKVLFDLLQATVHKSDGLPGIIKKCEKCKLVFKSFNRHLEALYSDEYAIAFFDLKEYSGEHAGEFYRMIVHPSRERINSHHPTLLDIGSGIGVMLEAAKGLGYDATGIEFSKNLADYAIKRGYKVINKNVSEISPLEKFDTITMMDIIEHLEDPLGVLKALKKSLSEKGELIVYTPNHDSLIVKIAGFLYKFGVKSPVENIFACVHTCFFSTKTLKMILEEAGYSVLETKHSIYDVSRPGQKVSFIAKLGIALLEKVGTINSS